MDQDVENRSLSLSICEEVDTRAVLLFFLSALDYSAVLQVAVSPLSERRRARASLFKAKCRFGYSSVARSLSLALPTDQPTGQRANISGDGTQF